ncbi:PLU-1-like protein-domain-containing protein [Phellopilus nigrolimitatus]|nr:PLU-1-like protein-domain-containing protein [Phellopilus nigrolimitatus]
MSSGSPQTPPRRTTPSRRGRSVSATVPASPGHSSYVSDTASNKPEATFISSLSIAVEGTVPIEKSTGTVPRTASSSLPAGEDRRAPRKSKTDALAALNRSRSPSVEEVKPAPSEQAPATSFLNTAPISVSSTLDMLTVKTASPRNLSPRTKPRPFDLEDCPIFCPSPEEFKDPMSYIRSISPQAQPYGIAKVVPPIGWSMPFVTDTESYRFKTRAMRLNSIEASSRAKINFLEALYRFHRQQGNPRVTVPTINHKPLDLWSLRKEVQKLGGFETVNKGKKWANLGSLLGYGGIPGLSTQLRNSYIRVILPYEHYSEGIRNAATFSTSKAREAQTPPPTSARTVSNGVTSPLSSPLSVTSSPLSEPPDDGDFNGLGESTTGSPKPRKANMNGSNHGLTNTNGKLGNGTMRPLSPDTLPAPIVSKDDSKGDHKPELTCCEICHKKNRGSEMLLCDGCDCGFHMFCLVPPLNTIPKGQWFCHTCLFGTGGDFGFDEGEEHSLSSFQARDQAFRKMWFETHPPPQPESHPWMEELEDPRVTMLGNVQVSETDVETEFWRLVQSPFETVEIEYGADVHSATHGSGMPTLETHPLDPYSKDAWNLNNIPILPESLLRYIKSEISGMTVPWTYVGMIFSTFCWHNEDHYTHSINYMHWGETKTWYGVPGEDAEKFEAAIKKEAPELFETQPDLLFQLVTLMSPARLKEQGVRVFACDQRAGEFVVTFPKAYHAGFNHGLNFNEAVNFALPDWLPLGRECVKRYQDHKKLPVFCHDELLITIFQQSHSIRTAIWLNDSFKEMTDQEMEGRRAARELGIREILEERDHPEDQYQCVYCKAFCYLSQVICPCPKASGARVVCLDHVKYLCDCPTSQRILRLRFSDEELLNIQTTISTRAAIPENWHNKLTKLLNDSARPQLRALRALAAEADRINYPLKELNSLRKCVARANDWIEVANSFTTRKQSRKRSKRHRWQPTLANGAGASDDITERPEKSLDELYAALKDVENLGFDSPEIGLLRNLAAQAEDFKARATELLQKISEDGDGSAHLQECETLLAHGSSLNVHLEELYKVENIVLQDQLIKELEDVDDSGITLDEIRQYLTRAKACDLPPDNKYMKLLETKLQAGNEWDERAASVLTQSVKTIEELDQFFDVESSIPVDPAVLNRIALTRSRALDFEKQAKAWLSPELGAALPKVQDALRLVQRAEKEFSIPAIHDLKRTADFAYDLEERCEAVLKNRYQHRDEGSVFDAMDKWRAYAREHLTKFELPSFDKLNEQLILHDQWMKTLPWWCPDHERPHGHEILNDVLDYTKPEDDSPPDDEFFTCICFDPVRPPPPGVLSDAVQCDHCFARFHGRCANNGGSCPFCDPNHWNGSIHRERSYHFCYLPTALQSANDISKNYSETWQELKDIVQHVERLCAVIGHFLSFSSQPGNQRPEYIPQVRHYMRKLYKIQFAVSPNPEVSFGLDLAGLHRILAGRPPPVRMKKRRKPRFVFGQDVDREWIDGTRCICRGQTPYLSGFALVECETCQRRYHVACVCFKGLGLGDPVKSTFTCPLCCLRKAKPYRWADIRVRMHGEPDPTIFVDVKACIETFSRSIIRIKLSPPVTPTLFIDLVQFTPGQPDVAIPKPDPPPPPKNSHHSGRVPIHVIPQRATPQASSSSVSNVPPPPPWSRSESVSAAPSHSPPAVIAPDPTIPFKRKRKHSGADGLENVHVFEVDPQVPNASSMTTHQGVHQATPSELNIIMQDPSQMAAVQQARPKQSPVSSQAPTSLPRPSASSVHPSSPQRQSAVNQSPQQHPPINALSPLMHTVPHSPQQRPPLAHAVPHSPQQRPPSHSVTHSPQQRPHSHSLIQSPQQRPPVYTSAHPSPSAHSSPLQHRTHITTSPHLSTQRPIPSPLIAGSSHVHAPRMASPPRDRPSPRLVGPSNSNGPVRKVKLVVRDSPSYNDRDPADP